MRVVGIVAACAAIIVSCTQPGPQKVNSSTAAEFLGTDEIRRILTGAKSDFIGERYGFPTSIQWKADGTLSGKVDAVFIVKRFTGKWRLEPPNMFCYQAAGVSECRKIKRVDGNKFLSVGENGKETVATITR